MCVTSFACLLVCVCVCVCVSGGGGGLTGGEMEKGEMRTDETGRHSDDRVAYCVDGD